jgi:hypothetical protein
MKHVPASLLWITLLAMPVYYPTCAQANLTAESARILAEGDRIKREADLMRSEATRLDSEADELQKGASYLDQLWERANKLDPNKYKDYAGRDKSQRRMRLDAEREKRDAVSLRTEGRRLDAEAVRLWKLAAAVDPQALKDLLDRLRNCCKLQTDLRRDYGLSVVVDRLPTAADAKNCCAESCRVTTSRLWGRKLRLVPVAASRENSKYDIINLGDVPPRA